MECLKVKLSTPTGIFKNPLSIKGIEVYPLPPYSTLIGLVYRAMGRRWNGEQFQISIQGNWEVILRDYVWLKKYNFKDKALEKLPLQVPILYNLELILHLRAEEKLLEEIERALKQPKELLFLSGGEYPVKIEEVKRVRCDERDFSEEKPFELKHNAYIPKVLGKGISTTHRGILFNLSCFYEKAERPKTYRWVEAYYFQKGELIYGELTVDEEGDAVFFTDSLREDEGAFSSGGEEVKFYADNWLMASACVGVLRILEELGQDVKRLVEGRTLKIPKHLWQKLPEIYADYLLKGKEEMIKLSYEKSKKDKNRFNAYNTAILGNFGDFYKNSPFTNQSKPYISKLKGFYSENIKEVSEKIKDSFLEAYGEFLSKTKRTYQRCFFCHERQAKNFVDATNFTPLFASMETVRNLVWDPIPTCKECEFLLYFAVVGFYKWGGRYLFVYVPDDLMQTYGLNLVLSTEAKMEQGRLGELWSVVKHILELEKQKSSWILQNIYFVEVEMVGREKATANIYSFHINPNLAKAIRKLVNGYPENMYKIFSEFLFYIYTGKSLYEFLFLLLSGFIRKDSYKNSESKTITIESRIVQAGKSLRYLSRKLLFFINFQEVLNMNEQRNYVNQAFGAGKELKRLYLKEESTKKKLEPITYRLLEAIRRKDKEYFIHNLIRAYLEVEEKIPPFFKEALDDKNFSMIAYAFLIGLNSEEREQEGEPEGASK